MDFRATCVRRADGRVRCWGQHEDGRDIVAVPIELDGVPEVAAIHLSRAGLDVVTREGELWTGALGLPEPTKLERWQGISEVLDVRHGRHLYALTRNGDVRAVDTGATSAPLLTNVIALNARDEDTVDALHRDGQVTSLDRGKPVKVRGVTDAETLFGAGCANRRGGGVACWDARGKPTKWVGPQNIVDRRSVQGVTCDLAGSGLACAGANEVGQLGTGRGLDRKDRKVIDLPGKVLSIAAGDRAWCAVLDNGDLACWGANDGGQLGDGTLIDRDRPVIVAGATSARPPTPARGKEPVAGSSVAMDWAGLPAGCTRPMTLPGPGGTTVTVASAYALAKTSALELWFADFALEPSGYRPGYAAARGAQVAIRISLQKGKDFKKTQPIDRGRYKGTDGPKRSYMQLGRIGVGAREPTDVLVEKVDREWVCGTLLDPTDASKRTPFAARVIAPRFKD